jgi:uncharacterized protein (TIGR02466 family)
MKNTPLKFDYCFPTPIYYVEIQNYLNLLNKISDEYIKKTKKENNLKIKNRNKKFKKDIKDHGMSHNSISMINDIRIKEFQNFIKESSFTILENQGYDMSNHKLFFSEMWVQEFAEVGGGHHETHIHSNNHISGFYFLKCSENTSKPVFHDPRPGKLMTDLPKKNVLNIDFSTNKMFYNIKPGTLMFFNSYLPHQFEVDNGIDPFRFIHFNLKAIPNNL